MIKVSGELYDLYFLQQQDAAQTSALMAEKTYFMSQAEIDEFYQPVLDLQEREQSQLWTAICSEYGLDPSRKYFLTRSGEVIQQPREPEEALAV